MSTLVEQITEFREEFPKLSLQENYHRIGKFIVAAREQAKELASLHEQIMRYQADPQYDARFIEGQDKTEAALKEQYSVDLREVAEMALERMHGWCSYSQDRNGGYITGPQPTADSILAEFLERQKAKMGK